VIGRLAHGQAALPVGDLLVAPGVLAALAGQVLSLLAEHHRTTPLSEGMPREEVRERLFVRAGAGIFDRVVGDLERAGRIGGRDRLALASHRVALSGEEEKARRTVEEAFRASGLTPPDPQAIASASGIPPDVADRVIKLLLRQRVLVKLETVVFHEQALARLKADMAALKAGTSAGQARIDVGTFKQRYGITRKFAIPLLEYLDRERITRRVGDSRVLI
jgi:selenocysteine-specific elongation factor